MRRAVRTAGRLAAAGLLALGVLNGAAWLLLPPPLPFNPSVRYVEETPHLTGSPRFTVMTNNKGFRNSPDFPLPEGDPRPRLLLIGDSQMFGGPNERTIDALLARRLPRYAVLNGGSPGADVAFYLEMIQHYLPVIRPRHLFVGLFLGNDFSGPLAEQRASVVYALRRIARLLLDPPVLLARRLAIQRGAGLGGHGAQPLTRAEFRARTGSEVAALCRSLCLDRRQHRQLVEAYDFDSLLDKYPALQCGQGVRVVVYAIVYREHLAESLLLQTANARRNYADALTRILALRERAAAQGVEPVFLLIPVSFTLDARYAAFYRDLGYSLPPPGMSSALDERARSDLAAAGLVVLDLRPALSGQDAFFAEDWHLNENGNRIVAKALASWVESREPGSGG